jgi:hypothetical protein
MTFALTVVVLLAVIAGVLAVLTLLGKPNGLVFVAVGVLLLSIAFLVQRVPAS